MNGRFKMNSRFKPILLMGFVAALAISCFTAGSSNGRDDYLYNNLMRSRDALNGQRDELQRARSDILQQIDRLNSKIARIDAYLRQVDDSSRDVNNALDNIK
jgi:septal ring factor EnvC (AmiA/AmiB activator)